MSLTLQDMQGLISFPSFHTAAALAVTWSLRRQRFWIWMPIALVNVGLVSATVFLGLHYVTDLIGTAAHAWREPRGVSPLVRTASRLDPHPGLSLRELPVHERVEKPYHGKHGPHHP